VCVSWQDAQAYVRWLSSRLGLHVRLPSEAEWEYAARAGTTTPYWWGTSIAEGQANFKASADGYWRQHTLPVRTFEPNPWGIYQVHGNVWEWIEDGWSPSYAGAPHDGTVREEAASSKRVVRGGSWLNGPRGVRSARRHAAEPGLRRSDIGFRIAAAVTL
jgi:formylglycine-generating enzyme required for sulfatase activity